MQLRFCSFANALRTLAAAIVLSVLGMLAWCLYEALPPKPRWCFTVEIAADRVFYPLCFLDNAIVFGDMSDNRGERENDVRVSIRDLATGRQREGFGNDGADRGMPISPFFSMQFFS